MNSLAKRFLAIPLGVAFLSVAACSSTSGTCDSGGYECSSSNNGDTNDYYGEKAGTVVGAAIGGIAGSGVGGGRGKAIASVVGAVIGLFIGKEIGKSIDDGLFSRATEVAQGSMDNNSDGETSTWKDPDSDVSGTITPQTTFKNDAGEDCRDFESTITVEGKTEVAHGRACRMPDGSWKIVN